MFQSDSEGLPTEKIKTRLLQAAASNSTTPSNSTGGGDNTPSVNPSTPAGQVSIPESSKKWKSLVSYEDRTVYEAMLIMKDSFQASLEVLPKSFQPEDESYIKHVAVIAIGFSVFAGIALVLIGLFLVLRFCCNKCVGPIKSSQVTRAYRNITWFLMSKFCFY